MTYLPWNRVRAPLWAVVVGVALVGAGITLAGRVPAESIQDRAADITNPGADAESSDLVDEIGESLAAQAVDPLQDFLRIFQRQFGAPPLQAAASGYIRNGSR